MPTVKAEIRKMIDALPEDVTIEDIQYHLYVRERIERARAEVEQGKLLDEDEVERRMAQWTGE